MNTDEGCCYICVVLELFSRKVIAYNVSDRNDTDLVLTTFDKAFFDRGNPKNLLFIQTKEHNILLPDSNMLYRRIMFVNRFQNREHRMIMR